MVSPRSSPPAVLASVAAGAAVLCLLVAAPVPAGASTPAAAATHAETEIETALSVTIDSLTPAAIPLRGPLRITGSVTNEEDVTWTAINVHPIVSVSPMTSRAELVDAAALGPDEPVGDRITVPGAFDTIDRIEPGETAQFTIRLPRALLPDEPGVYWFGAHALGDGAVPRDSIADGRARTFLPLVEGSGRPVRTALVIPLRRRLAYAPDGSLDDVEGWTRTLDDGGKLRSIVDFGASAGSRPVTWLLDPALPDAVRRLVAGNPPRSLAPTLDEEPEPSGSPSPDGPGPVPSASPTIDGDGDEEPAEPVDPAVLAASEVGTAWLDRLREALDSHQILALPYGDLDVAAAAEHDPDLYDRARGLSGDVLEPWGLPMSAAVGSPSGYLDRAGIELVAPEATVLVTDRLLGDTPPAVGTAAGGRLVATSAGAAAGGPGPGDPLGAVNLRQRILSEAALRRLEGDGRPLVVVLPPAWRPTGTSDFFSGLDVDWVELVSLEDAVDRRGRAVDLDTLAYPERQARRELDAASFAVAAALTESGETLQNLLTRNDAIASVIADEALGSTSYAAREAPLRMRASVERSRAWVQDRLEAVRIEGPRGVNLSSASGEFPATIINGTDQPVTVGIEALTDGRLRVDVPEEVEVAAGATTSVLLTARTSELGVHRVTLVLTDTDGTPLGSTYGMPIRSAQVSNVIWLILGTGAALLFGAILVRLVRRVRAARGGAVPVEAT